MEVVEQVVKDWNSPVEKKPTSTIFDKSRVVGKQEVKTIKDLTVNQFGKNCVVLDQDGNDCELALSNQNWNDLIDKLGEIPSQWIGKQITITAEEYVDEGKTKRKLSIL